MIEALACRVSAAYTSVTGTYHSAMNEDNEDLVYFREGNDMCFYGLADGRTGRKYSREGGREVLRYVTEYILNKGITALRRYEYVDEIRYELIKIIRDALADKAKQYDADMTEFSSTLVFFAFDVKTGEYITIHLGDGGIIGRHQNGSVSMISEPENGLTSQYTWLTTSNDALLHLRVTFGHLRDHSRVVMYTDGARSLCNGRNILNSAKDVLINGNAAEIFDDVVQARPSDDASCIVIDIDHDISD